MHIVVRNSPYLVAALAGLVACAAIPGNVRAAIALDSMHTQIAPDRTTGQLTVYNVDPSTAYVRVDVVEITVDGQEAEVNATTENTALLVSPNRLIVPGGGRQVVRLIAQGARGQERYFRVRFVPVAPKKSEGFGIGAEEELLAAQAMQAQLNIQIGYGARVVVAPRSPRFATTIIRTTTGHEIRNGGNATIYLANHRVCALRGTNCLELPEERLDPGRDHPIPAESDRHHTFDLREGASTTPKNLRDID